MQKSEHKVQAFRDYSKKLLELWKSEQLTNESLGAWLFDALVFKELVENDNIDQILDLAAQIKWPVELRRYTPEEKVAMINKIELLVEKL